MKKEKISIGEKVFLVHLQEEGVVQRVINDDLIYVVVDGMEIPVFTTDANHEFAEPEIQIAEEKNGSTGQQKTAASEKLIGTNTGIFLSFEPVYSGGDEISSFNIYLINDTEHPIEFDYSFLLNEKVSFALKKLIVPFNYVLLHSIEYDLLNEMPRVELHVRDVMNKAFKGKLDQKIKPQNFFNKLSHIVFLQKENYNYKLLMESLQPVKEVMIKTPKKTVDFDPEVLKRMMFDIPVNKDNEIASAVEEIDLHIEVLMKNYDNLTSSEKLQMQLSTFQQALERALAHRTERLYVIHGVGSGKLKKEIHQILKSYKEVHSFNNDYHSRYGYGATEIILR